MQALIHTQPRLNSHGTSLCTVSLLVLSYALLRSAAFDEIDRLCSWAMIQWLPPSTRRLTTYTFVPSLPVHSPDPTLAFQMRRLQYDYLYVCSFTL